jgi:hypothetical protein
VTDPYQTYDNSSNPNPVSAQSLPSLNTPPAATEPGRSSSVPLGNRIHTGAYYAKCVIVGGLFAVGGVAVLAQGSWVGLIALVYGLWVLSGLVSGGWRLFIY